MPHEIRNCSYCGTLTTCETAYPQNARLACADCILGGTGKRILLVDFEACLIHAESLAIRHTAWCGDPISEGAARITSMPLDMLPGALCQWCKTVILA